MALRRHTDDPAAADGAPALPGPSHVDLHTHTVRSDGTAEPGDLVAAAAAVGVRTLAIADHDTLTGYRELASRADGSTGLPLDLVPAVEINAVATSIPGLHEGELHLLGYGVDPDDEAFEALLRTQRAQRVERFARLVMQLRKIGLPIDDQVAALERPDAWSLGRPTAARALVAAGHAESVNDAFERILGSGQPGYVARDGIGPLEAITAIRSAGGLPVLAHFPEALARRALIRELQAAGLGGLEVYYISFDADRVAGLAVLAADLSLVPTGGSDYHGDLGPYAEMHARLRVPDAVADGLREALAPEPHPDHRPAT